ncbi:MAG: TrbI F-type domain-containing protein [Alphaproteobacteria bacterium]|nr:TrbI F-type domain-containing protein [Alphaproteobacteria bacterium]
MRRRRDAKGRTDPVWPVLVSAVLLSGAVAAAVAAAAMRYGVEPPPRIGGVRLAEMTAAWTTRAAAEGVSAEAVRVWGAALETALDRVARDHGVVLLPARAVAAGAPDMTGQVEDMLAAILADRGSGPSAVSGGERP